MGAPWPGAVPAAASESLPKNPAARSFTEEEKGFWSYQPLKNAAPPQVKNEAWAQSPIDRFILQKLEEKNLKPAPPADKLTLLRRATFDLTGLPPTEAEMRDFLGRPISRRVQKSRRAFARQSSVRRTLGTALAGRGALRRFDGQRRRSPLSVRLEIPRLRHRIVQQRPALRSIHSRTGGGRSASRATPPRMADRSIAEASSPRAFWPSARKPSRSRTRRRCFMTCTTNRLTSRPERSWA